MNVKYEYLDGNMNSPGWEHEFLASHWTNFKEQLNHSSKNNYKTTLPCDMNLESSPKRSPVYPNAQVCKNFPQVSFSIAILLI